MVGDLLEVEHEPMGGEHADANDETLEVVNEDNQVVGRALRREVHLKGLLHRAVYCFVFNTSGDLLLQRRSFRHALDLHRARASPITDRFDIYCIVGWLVRCTHGHDAAELCRKRIGPGLWDVSLAEHLNPGESYAEAAIRGLKEELGIEVKTVEGPLNPPFRRRLQVSTVTQRPPSLNSVD
jgi:isopentenyl-diphosphate Delta-isomerase